MVGKFGSFPAALLLLVVVVVVLYVVFVSYFMVVGVLCGMGVVEKHMKRLEQQFN